MTPKATSYTQLENEIEQHPHMKRMSIEELMTQHMNEDRDTTKMSLEGQRESLPNILEVNPKRKKKDMKYNEDISLRSNEEFEKLE